MQMKIHVQNRIILSSGMSENHGILLNQEQPQLDNNSAFQVVVIAFHLRIDRVVD